MKNLESWGVVFFSRAALLFIVCIFALSENLASATNLVFAWDRNPEADVVGYRVSYGYSPQSYQAPVDTAETTFSLRGLQNGQTVYFIVQARNASGVMSAPSSELAVRVGNTVASLGPRICGDWNTMLSNRRARKTFTNIFELRNTSTKAPEAIRIRTYNNAGKLLRSDAFRLAPLQQFDYVLNGRIPDQQIGSVCVEHSGGLDGAMTYYFEDRAPRARKRFQLAYAIPLSDGFSGDQAVTFNTYEPSHLPSQQAFNVANWLTIRNSDDHFSDGSILIYDMLGKFISSFHVALQPGERRDFDLHSFGKELVGTAIWKPNDLATRFVMRNTRYMYDNAQWKPSFLTAVPLEGRVAAPGAQTTVINTLGGKMGVVEISNVLPIANAVSVQVYRSDGALLRNMDLPLGASESRHVIVDPILGSNAVGQVIVRGSEGGGAVAYGLEYGFRPSGELRLISGSPATSAAGAALKGSYNVSQRQRNLAFIGNTSGQAASFTLAVAPRRGGTRLTRRAFAIPAYGVQVIDLNRFIRGSTSGSILVESAIPGILVASVERTRPGDFALSLPIREG